MGERVADEREAAHHDPRPHERAGDDGQEPGSQRVAHEAVAERFKEQIDHDLGHPFPHSVVRPVVLVSS